MASRLTVQQRCGARLYDDYTELDPGSLKDLQTELYGMNSSDPQASQNNQPQSFMKRVTKVFNQSMAMLKSTRKASATEDISLPLHLDPHHANGPRQLRDEILHILCCIHSGDFGVGLHQERVANVSTDKGLMMFLRTVYQERRSKLSWFRLRQVSKLLLSRVCTSLSK